MTDETIEKFVNNTIKEFLDDMNEIIRQKEESKSGPGPNETELELRHILAGHKGTGIVYNGKKHNARYLLLKLQEFAGGNCGSWVDAKIKHFMRILPYLSMFEEGGILGMNERINKLFTELKKKGGGLSQDEADEKIDAMNGILYAAIYIFPHLAHSIEIKLIPGKVVSAEERQKLYGHHYTGERLEFDRMRLLVHGEIEKLFVPLPYGFNTRRTGHQDRMAKGSSYEEIYFECSHPKDDWRRFDPTVVVKIAQPAGSANRAYFSFGEVEYVRFSDNAEFTPYYADGINDRGSYEILVPRKNCVSHYLSFRGFNNLIYSREKKGFKGVPDHVLNYYWNNICEPSAYGTEFFRRECRMLKKDLLKTGFMASKTVNVEHASADQMMLLEFADVELSSDSSASDTASLFFKAVMEDGNIKDHVKQYFGNDVIERLFRIPIWERK